MNKQLSAEDQKKLLVALKKMGEDVQVGQDKAEEKKWTDIEVPLSLADALARLSKTELSAIRVNLNVKGASALNKKELSVLLAQHIIEALPVLLLSFDLTRYNVLKQTAACGGFASLPLEPRQVNYFTERGLLFPGKYKGQKMLVMPVEVMQAFAACDHASCEEAASRNTELIRLTVGLLYYYGTLNIDQLAEMAAAHTEKVPRIFDYVNLIEDADHYYKYDIKGDSAGFSHGKASNAENVKKEHKARKELPFYPFTKEQLMLAGEPGFVDRNAAYQAFVDFIDGNYKIKREEADELIQECVFAVQNDRTPNQLFQFLQEFLEIGSLDMTKAFMEHIIQLHNHTRHWALKGHTPNELSPEPSKVIVQAPPGNGKVIDFTAKKKIGRNDPCPCGSGKKFKKCCAN